MPTRDAPVRCVRKLSDAYFDRIARIGNTAAASVFKGDDTRSGRLLQRVAARAAPARDDEPAAAGGAELPEPEEPEPEPDGLACLFAGVGDFRNVMSTVLEVYLAAVEAEEPSEVAMSGDIISMRPCI